MFQRLILEDSAALYTIAAFCVAASIFTTVCWRAVRMRQPQIEKFANIPFETATPASEHERRPENPSN